MTAKLLGKDQTIKKVDEETGEVVTITKKKTGKPISSEEVKNLKYKALVSEGGTLYKAKEYHRAIDAFTQAMEMQKEDPNILIDRANCYIQVGQPEDAIRDVDAVLKDNEKNPKAILTKAEAYFSMGEFEFALVFFQRGLFIRKDISAFRDGVIKCRSAILDSINGQELFQANPNFTVTHQRKTIGTRDRSAPRQEIDEQKLAKTAELLPEKVAPLTVTEDKKQFLGELQLDYDYLLELQDEIEASISSGAENFGKKEDEKISSLVKEALVYLDQRGAFWYQQGGSKESATKSRAKTQNTIRKDKSSGASTTKTQTPEKARKTVYETSKVQQYEERQRKKGKQQTKK
ncbi:TPR Domain containing protein [Histomonas meleagridis]|uniref:TPR Domain containing protein n=1 Tax=Histomonas meleagridis TaxID=135588 RepID=UPI00355A2728|nr:TPR Domain containing protein [Histomonas meleagridis]KAH0806928.1 TPR Domain containing protein [Histomonas meleagridis]